MKKVGFTKYNAPIVTLSILVKRKVKSMANHLINSGLRRLVKLKLVHNLNGGIQNEKSGVHKT